MKGFQPVIKWSGSKRNQAHAILAYMPTDFETYYEPFIGGGSVMCMLSPKKGVAGDTCQPLVAFWNMLREFPNVLIESYAENWQKLQDKGVSYYYEVRDRFNRTKAPEDLLFLSRTSINGLIRFNNMGNFNSPFHHNRKGIEPHRLGEIITMWSERIQGMTFVNKDFRKTLESATKDDFVYLDPPYFHTKGMFGEKLAFEELCDCLEDLNKRGIRFMLSYDGNRGDKSMVVELPQELYKRHEMMYSGNSSFSRLFRSENRVVYESLYLNW